MGKMAPPATQLPITAGKFEVIPMLLIIALFLKCVQNVLYLGEFHLAWVK
jgi:hypothetical protein